MVTDDGVVASGVGIRTHAIAPVGQLSSPTLLGMERKNEVGSGAAVVCQ